MDNDAAKPGPSFCCIIIHCYKSIVLNLYRVQEKTVFTEYFLNGFITMDEDAANLGPSFCQTSPDIPVNLAAIYWQQYDKGK